MESWSSTVRRRAWINSSRHWSTLEEPDGPAHSSPCVSTAEDDVFSDGKIENWLLGCGSESCSENSGQLSFDSVRQAYNFVDDLSLGADASALNGGKVPSAAGLAQHSPFKQRSRFSSSTSCHQPPQPPLNLGDSIASSCFSSSTWKSTSSVPEVLDLYSENAEETLLDLGFGCEEPQVTVRIPPRFFTFPSQARGINFRLFLDSQLRRIREEDPSLSLASRFRQVQVLTAMANAFYSLYSHVSRTPLQKLAAPEFNFASSPVERMERFRSNVRSEPRSPVERLKDTVNKMCLYTGSPRGSDSTSPQPSPRKRSSLPDVLEEILKGKRGVIKKLDLGAQSDWHRDAKHITTGDRLGQIEQTEPNMEDMDNTQTAENNATRHKRAEEDDAGERGLERTDLVSRTLSGGTAISSTISGETEIEETEPHFIFSQAEPDVGLTSHETRTAEKKPVAKVTYDLICPQITESVHQAPFCCQNTQSLPPISCQAESEDKTQSHNPHIQTAICSEDVATAGELAHMDATRSSVLESGYTPFSITVTGWEGDDASCSLNTADSSHASSVSSRQMCKESFHEKETQYLNPRHGLQPVNSFELEEVQSAGEEDFGGAASTLSISSQSRGAVVRGDSMQSDSSGYADEEVGLSSDRQNR